MKQFKQPDFIGDVPVVSSVDFYSSLSHDIPRMTDNPMSRRDSGLTRQLSIIDPGKMKEPPIIRLKALLPPEINTNPLDAVRHMYTSQESIMYLYPLSLENFKDHRNLCVQIELVEFASNPSATSSLSTTDHHALPCIVNQTISPKLTTQAYTTVYYHNKSPSLRDEIKIRLPEYISPCHFIKFTVIHIHVKPKYVSNGNFLGGLLGNQSKEMDSSFVVAGVGYMALLESSGDVQNLIPDNEYTLPLTENFAGPVADSDNSERSRRSLPTSSAPIIKFATKSISSFNSSCKVIQRLLRNFPRYEGGLPSSSFQRFGDSFSGIKSLLDRSSVSIDTAVVPESVILQILHDLNTNGNKRELQKFYFIVFRFLCRMIKYTAIESNSGDPNSTKQTRDSEGASISTDIQIRSFAFLSLVKSFNIMAGQQQGSYGNSLLSGGEATVKAYVELLFDEEEDVSTYRMPTKTDTADSPGRLRSSSFTFADTYNEDDMIESPTSILLNSMVEYFVSQCERFIYESVIQEVVDELDVTLLFEKIYGNSDNHEFQLPHNCIRWWTDNINHLENNDINHQDKRNQPYQPFDFEKVWFGYMESLHWKSYPSVEGLKLKQKEIEEKISENGEEIIFDTISDTSNIPVVTALPCLPRYDRLVLSQANQKLWIFEELSVNWLALLYTIRLIGSDQESTKSIFSSARSVSYNCIDHVAIYRHIPGVESKFSSRRPNMGNITISDIRNDLANNSSILFRLIWKSLCLRIIRQNLKAPIIIPDEFLSVIVELLLQISYELSDTSGLGIRQCRRLTIATANFVRSLFVIVVPNQLKVLLSTCLLSFNDCYTEEYLELKLLMINLIVNVDNFVALNAPYTDDCSFKDLLVSGNADDHQSLQHHKIDKFASTCNYRYQSGKTKNALQASNTMLGQTLGNSLEIMDDLDTDSVVLPSWFATSIVNELLALTRVGHNNVKKAALGMLRNVIIKPFQDIRFNMTNMNDSVRASTFSRISTLYLPLLLNLISTSDKLRAQSYDSTQRKEVLIVAVGLLQNISEKVLRGLLKHFCALDHFIYSYRMPITPPNQDKLSILNGEQNIINRCKIQSLLHLLHLILDTFERPSVTITDPSYPTQALALLAPEINIHGNAENGQPLKHSISAGNDNQFNDVDNLILVASSKSASSLNETITETIGRISTSSDTPSGQEASQDKSRRIKSAAYASPGASRKGTPRPRDSDTQLQSKSDKLFGYKTSITPFTSIGQSNNTNIAERKRLADVVKNEFITPSSLEIPSPRIGARQMSLKKSSEFMAMECCLSVASMASMTTLRVIQALLEELPQLYHHRTDKESSGTDDDSFIHFISSVLLVLLHTIFSSPTIDVTWRVFYSVTWIIQHLGFHVFYYAAGDTLQDWIRKGFSVCYDVTAIESSKTPKAYVSPRASPDVQRELTGDVDGSSHFVAMLLYSCFVYTGSLLKVKYIFLSVSQEFITSIVNEDQEGLGGKKKVAIATKRHQSSIDILRERFNNVFTKILKSSVHISCYYQSTHTQQLHQGVNHSFLSSVENILSKIRTLVKAYSYLVKQIGVDRIIRFSFNGENLLDTATDTIPVTEMNANDMVEIPRVVAPLKIDDHVTIELLMKAATVFDPLYLPRFHLFWLENMAMIHDVYGNTAESAITRLRIYDACKDVADVWDSLWVPHPPSVWTSRASNGKGEYDMKSRDFFKMITDKMKGPRPQAWKDWYQYRQHLKTVLMKTISILSAAGITRWEQKVSNELVSFYQFHGEYSKAAEEFTRLGASVLRATTRGLDKFSMGNFYRVHYSGYAIPGHLKDKTFVYRDARNSHISEFQASIKDSLARLMDNGVEISIGSDAQEQSPSSNSHAAMIIMGSIRPDHILGQTEVDFSHKVNTFQYEIPFTLTGKSHSQRIDEQYKRKIALRVEYPFPCTFVRQEVVFKDIQVLNPIEVAIDDIRERVNQMKGFVSMRSIRDPTILREMMRVLQGSIMPQVHAGVAEVAKTFLSKVRPKSVPSFSSDSSQINPKEITLTIDTEAKDNGCFIPIWDTKQLEVS